MPHYTCNIPYEYERWYVGESGRQQYNSRNMHTISNNQNWSNIFMKISGQVRIKLGFCRSKLTAGKWNTRHWLTWCVWPIRSANLVMRSINQQKRFASYRAVQQAMIGYLRFCMFCGWVLMTSRYYLIMPIWVFKSSMFLAYVLCLVLMISDSVLIFVLHEYSYFFFDNFSYYFLLKKSDHSDI